MVAVADGTSRHATARPPGDLQRRVTPPLTKVEEPPTPAMR